MCGDIDRDSIGARLRARVGNDEAAARAHTLQKAQNNSILTGQFKRFKCRREPTANRVFGEYTALSPWRKIFSPLVLLLSLVLIDRWS
jgi:hypothetical protein